MRCLTRKLEVHAGDQPSKANALLRKSRLCSADLPCFLHFMRAKRYAISPKWNIAASNHVESRTHCFQLQWSSIHPNMSYLDHISINQWYVVGIQQGHAPAKRPRNVQDNFASTAVTELFMCWSDAGASQIKFTRPPPQEKTVLFDCCYNIWTAVQVLFLSHWPKPQVLVSHHALQWIAEKINYFLHRCRIYDQIRVWT